MHGHRELPGYVTLAAVWNEPEWEKLAVLHDDISALIRVMLLYKRLPQKSHSGISMEGVTADDWQANYIKGINLMKKYLSIEVTNARFDRFFELFPKLLTIEQRYALSRIKGKKLACVSYESPKTRMLTRVLIDLKWPAQVTLSEIRRLPVELITKDRDVINWGLGQYNEKSITLPTNERFPNYRSALVALYKEIITSREQNRSLPRSHNIPTVLIPVQPVVKQIANHKHIVASNIQQRFRFAHYLTKHEVAMASNLVGFALECLSKILCAPVEMIIHPDVEVHLGHSCEAPPSSDTRITLNRTMLTGELSTKWLMHFEARLATESGYPGRQLFRIEQKEFSHGNASRTARLFRELVVNIANMPNLQARSRSISKHAQYKGFDDSYAMLSRAFEAYLCDELVDKNMECDLLADISQSANSRFNPYPENEERVLANAWFRNFFKLAFAD